MTKGALVEWRNTSGANHEAIRLQRASAKTWLDVNWGYHPREWPASRSCLFGEACTNEYKIFPNSDDAEWLGESASCEVWENDLQ